MPRQKVATNEAEMSPEQLVRRYKQTGEAREGSRHIERWRRLFDAVDRNRLWAAGAAAPEREMIGFRGVPQGGLVDGLSWSTSLDVACWFAMRSNRPKPAVYLATIEPSEVYVILKDDSGEQEVIALPRQRYRIAISPAEIERRAQRYLDSQGE